MVGLPSDARRSEVSMPWSTALRRRCSSGSNSASTMVASASVPSPSVISRTVFPTVPAISRTSLGKRRKTVRSGSTRTLRTAPWSSVANRSNSACWSRKVDATAAGSSLS